MPLPLGTRNGGGRREEAEPKGVYTEAKELVNKAGLERNEEKKIEND
jgi:hypothetical protein